MGYFTRADLQTLWVGATDSSYNGPFLAKGDGGGLEVYGQVFAQLERVSRAIDNTFGAMYLLPSSAQTADPASGERYARVLLELARTGRRSNSLVVFPRSGICSESIFDHGPDGAVAVLTGRDYATESDAVFVPGDVSPKQVWATSTVPGWGANNPLPETIKAFPAAPVVSGIDATIEAAWPADALVAKLLGDGFSYANIGQYVELGGATNAGKIRRIEAIGPVSIADAGKAILEPLVALLLSSTTGTYQAGEEAVSACGGRGKVLYYDPISQTMLVRRTARAFMVGEALAGSSSGAASTIGDIPADGMLRAFFCTSCVGPFLFWEQVVQTVTGAQGRFVAYQDSVLYIATTDSAFVSGSGIVGVMSFALAIPAAMGWDPMLVPESGTVEWTTLDWSIDLSLTSRNPEQPSGGRSGMLDALGMERGLPRISSEPDEDYRLRISKLGDTVSPNAISRAIVRGTKPLGIVGKLREIGTEDFRGVFYDAPGALAPTIAFSYDLDFDVRPQDRWNVYVDYASFRAYFLVEIPNSDHGESGFAYDSHPFAAFDSGPFLSFFDGSARITANALKAMWADIYERRAGGVGFDFVREFIPAP